MPRVIGTAVVSFMVDDSTGTPHDIKGEVKEFSDDDSENLLDVTTVDEAEVQRAFGLHDSSLSISCFVNDDAGSTADVFLFNKKGERTVKIGFKANLYYNGEFLIQSTSTPRSVDGGFMIDVKMEQAKGVTATWTKS